MGHETVAVITGGARGIGAAIATQIVQAGGRVALGDLDSDAALTLVRRLGSSATFRRTDATNENDVSSLLEHAEREHGPVTAVFANAGATGAIGPLESTTRDDAQATMDLLFGSVFLAFSHGIAMMRPRGKGALVATSSVAGLRGGLGPHLYTAAKHAVTGLVESLAVEVAPYGLTVNAVAPGPTVSSLSAALMGSGADDLGQAYDQLATRSSSGVPTTSEDVARAAVFLSGSPRINGVSLVVDGGDVLPGSSGRRYYSPT